jgi:hypothetical protein
MNPFDSVISGTHCPYAKRARVFDASEWNPLLSYEMNILDQAEAIRCVSNAHMEYEGVLTFVPTNSRTPLLPEVVTEFRRYLWALSALDSTCLQVMRADKLSTEWQFTFASTRYFLNVFASCYSQQHSKYVESEYGFFVFLQPESSFKRCPGRPLDEMKISIRSRFARAGMPYDGSLVDERIESHLYIFPLQYGDAPVEWWHEE